MHPGQAYREGRHRITAAVRGLDDDRLATIVPACPRWRVRDVVAHLSGICADVIAGNVEGRATELWTAAQVDARYDWPFTKILDEWDTNAPPLEDAATDRRRASQWIFDLSTHEHDLRGALGTPRPAESTADEIALEFVVFRFGRTLDEAGIPALRVTAPQGDLVLGSGEPQATVTATRYELLRLVTGRRSLDQVRGLAWEGDPAPYVQALAGGWGPFHASEHPLAD